MFRYKCYVVALWGKNQTLEKVTCLRDRMKTVHDQHLHLLTIANLFYMVQLIEWDIVLAIVFTYRITLLIARPQL